MKLYINVTYQAPTPFFHTVSSADVSYTCLLRQLINDLYSVRICVQQSQNIQVGFNFASEPEAAIFYSTVRVYQIRRGNTKRRKKCLLYA